MNFNFNQALADKGRRQDDALAVDRYNAETQRIAALRGGGGGGSTQTAKPEPAPNYAQIGNIASIATKNAYDTAYKPPISNPAPGVYGDSTSIFDQKPRLKEGGIIDSIKGILGVRKPVQNNDQAKDANRVANQTGGMVGGAAKALQSRQLRIEEELKRQGLRKGTTFVKDKTGKGSPTKDTVDAKLAEGEAVLNAGAAKILGRKSIAELNAQGLQAMGMQGAKPKFKDGKVHAYGGIDFNDPEMKAKAQNMEMQRRMAAGPRQPVVQPTQHLQTAKVPGTSMVPVGRPTITSGIQPSRQIATLAAEQYRPNWTTPNPRQGVTPPTMRQIASKAAPYMKAAGGAATITSFASMPEEEKVKVASAINPALGVVSAFGTGARSYIADKTGITSGIEKLKNKAGSMFDSEQVAQPANAAKTTTASNPVQSKTNPNYEIINLKADGNDRVAQAKTLDDMSEAYRNAPVNKRTVDMSNADFAAQGMGDIAKIVKNGKTEYTNVGNRNKFNNEEAQARTVGYKAQEKARADSVAQQLATPADVEKQAGQFALSQAKEQGQSLKRIQDMQQQYIAEQDAAKRNTMAENIAILTGKPLESKKKLDVKLATRKVYNRDTQGQDEEPIVYDPNTGQWLQPTQSSQQFSGPAVGTIGFQGGQQAVWDGKGWKAVK